MSASLNMVEAASHAARAKGEQVTDSSEAGRQRGTPDPCGLRHPDAEPQAVTCSEPRRSIVMKTRSDAVSESAEPLFWWRRQHPPANPVARPMGLSGVAGAACGESCSGEGGRSGIVLLVNDEVRGAISETREGRSNAVPEVRGDDSSDEVPVMGIDAKRPHFDGAADEATGSPSRSEGA